MPPAGAIQEPPVFKLFLSSLLMLAGFASPTPGRCGDVPPADREVLAALARDGDAHWDAADAASLAALFAEDADLRLGEGPVQRGRAAVLAYFARSFGGRAPHLRHRTELVSLNEVAPGVVVADALVRLERAAPGEAPVLLRRFVNHTVLVKEDGAWRFKAVRAHPLPAETPGA